jgi:hypothetical protein
LKRSADAGYIDGYASDGQTLHLSVGISQDFVEAMKYLRKGAESENL